MSEPLDDAPAYVHPKRLPALDALRAIGAIAVVVTHVSFATGFSFRSGFAGGITSRLEAGVAVFFVLSGFLLFRPFALAAATGLRRPGTGPYLWRRALRILPAYWAMLLVGMLALAVNRQAPLGDWLRYATLTEIYQQGWNRQGIAHTWSLATEAVFYILLPALAMATLAGRWRPRRSLWAIVCFGVVVSGLWYAGMVVGITNIYKHTAWFPTYAFWFSAGMALAIAHVALRTGTAPRRWSMLDQMGAAPVTCWAIAVSLLIIASTPLAGPRHLGEYTIAQLVAKHVLYLSVAVMILIPTTFGPHDRYKRLLEGRTSHWLALLSYGVFLWHPLVIEAIYLGGNRPRFTGGLVTISALTLAGSLVMATLSYYLVERPFMQLSYLWADRRPQLRQPEQADRGEHADLGPQRDVAVA
jgi:peptidoglycan/LPS O-acetylase OafA/YrhL